MKPCSSGLSDPLRALLLQRDEVQVAPQLSRRGSRGTVKGWESWLGARIPLSRQLPSILGVLRATAGPQRSGRSLRLVEMEGLGASVEAELSLRAQVWLRLHTEL